MYLRLNILSSCNLRCKHCYYKKNVGFDGKEMDICTAKNIIKQAYNIYGKELGVVIMGGGEPFLYNKLFELLEYSAKKLKLKTSITTNATLLDYNTIIKIKKLGILLNISIEGKEKYNDKIRGKGTFKLIVKTILLANKVGTLVSLNITLNKNNILDIPFLVKMFSDKVEYITFSRYIPYIKNDFMEELSKDDYLVVEKLLNKFKNKKLIFRQEKFFEKKESNIFHFNIKNLKSLYVLPDSTIYPAWNLTDFKLGKINKNNLLEILNNGLLEKLYNPENLIGKYCSKCKYKYTCSGDRGVAYFYTNSFFGDDIQCPFYIEK